MTQKKSFFFVVLLFVILTIAPSSTVNAATLNQTGPWCGTTSETDNYGFNLPLEQYHWTVNGENYITQEAIDEVDVLYDSLNADNIANTMILFIDSQEVSNGPNCAGHFLMYMRLGNIDGPREANGMSIIFIITETDNQVTAIKVNYSVGGSLNALLPDGMKEMDRIAQQVFAETGSVTETYLAVMRYFEQYARSKYEPYYPPTSTPEYQDESQPQAQGLPAELIFLCCVGLFILAFVLFIFWWIGTYGGTSSGGDGGGIDYSPPTYKRQSNPSSPSSPSRPSSSPSYKSSPSKPSSSPSFKPSSSPSSKPSSPPSRGGSGSGRTNRTG